MTKRECLLCRPLPLKPDSELEIKCNWDDAVEPLVSIICHTYQHEAYIADALNGFLAQITDFSFEIIVHDDASADRTCSIIQDYRERYPRLISVVQQRENQFSKGKYPSAFTFKAASGEYIALCEGDDYWTDRFKLQRQVDAMRKYPSADLCVHPAVMWREKTQDGVKVGVKGSDLCLLPYERVFKTEGQFAPTASMMFKSSALEGFPRWFFEDPKRPQIGDFFVEVFTARKGVVYLPALMAVYRANVEGSHSSRMMAAGSKVAIAEAQALCSYVARLKEISGMPRELVEYRIRLIQKRLAKRLFFSGEYRQFRKIIDPSYEKKYSRRAFWWFASSNRVGFILLRRLVALYKTIDDR